jgi:acyl-[acyl-carrier-protein] desaturase
MSISTDAVIHELSPIFERLLDRHLRSAKEWFPHELVPWSRGRDFVPDQDWDPSTYPLDNAVRSALFINLLTEDNLPYYFYALQGTATPDGAVGAWGRRWTAEEARHAAVIRDYVLVTRAVDPVQLERERMLHMSRGFTAPFQGMIDGGIYASIQELATRISHHNTAKCLDDPVGNQLLTRVAADENLHYLYYRDACSAFLEVWPSEFVRAAEVQLRAFQMPGAEIRDFQTHALAIAQSGIYNFAIHHEQILIPLVMRHWKIDALTGLDADAETARDRIMAHLERTRRAACRFRDRFGDTSPEPVASSVR